MIKTEEELLAEIGELRARLREAESDLSAVWGWDSGFQDEQAFPTSGLEIAYCTLLEQSNEGAANLDSSGAILYCNRRFAEMLNVPLGRAPGLLMRQLIAPEDVETFEAFLHRSAEASSKAEVTVKSQDGALVPALLSATGLRVNGVGNICLVVTDLTERKRIEAALRESDERLRLTARATNDVVWDWELLTGNVWWSERFLTQFGYTGREVAPDSGTWTEHLHPDDVERVISGVASVLESRGEFWADEYRFRRADGSYASVLDCGHVIYDSAGEAVRMIGSMLDITGREQVERMASNQSVAVGEQTQPLEPVHDNLVARDTGIGTIPYWSHDAGHLHVR